MPDLKKSAIMKIHPIVAAIFFTLLLLISIISCDDPFVEKCDCELNCAGEYIPNTICEQCVTNRKQCRDTITEDDIITFCGSADASYTVSTSMCM